MRTKWISFVSLFSLALAGCTASPAGIEGSPTQENKDAVPSATSAVATSTVGAISEWQTYSNAQAGYSAKYPAGWTVKESLGTNSELVTTFMAPDNQQGLTVSVLRGETTVGEIPDMPNTRCQSVKISGLPGRRCLDTVVYNISTTFSQDNRQFSIVTIGKNPDQGIYQSFLENFTVKS